MSKYKVVVSNTTIVNIATTLKDEGGRNNQYKFDLICTRMGADDLKQRLDNGETTKEIMRSVTTNWRGQRLVLESDDKPAEFSDEAFEAMLDIPHLATVLFNSYYTQQGAAAKN
ncbi:MULTISPECIES: hypothetical protein [unclassified Duganella]|jgi:hypothetical protein|uniref:hypothetical protein n=1 Tax=unclassified Duganella TaxID=2636909 RepID=UPI0008869B19|nr:MULTISPECIES: hypothetical protein [unclassified Duganella]SDH40763.1 hypothetical protein SAMN05216320_1132 [Duganella sp. OV458]SDK61301.1 hypothetical protein SAMN05428973_113161 [Duganella sp. OV510]